MNDTLKAAGRIGAELGAAKAEVERMREVLSRIANLPMYQCSTENDYRLSAAKAMAVGALTHQADPTETTEAYTAVDMATAAAQGFRDGQAAVEQAAAQDEREFNTSDSDLTELLNIAADMLKGVGGGMDLGIYFATVLERVEQRLATNPAQTEQQPVAAPKCATCNGFGKELSVYEGGIPCRSCKSDPTPAQDEREAFKHALHSQNVFKLSSATIDAAEWAWFARPAQTAPQPEQDDMALFDALYKGQVAAEKAGMINGTTQWGLCLLRHIRAAMSTQGGEQ